MINYEFFTEEDKLIGKETNDIEATTFDNINLHVYPTMMAPGKNYYAIKVPDENKLFKIESVTSVNADIES